MNTLQQYDPDNPYPDSDGLPITENTQQYDWLVKIKENLEILFADRNDVFIAGDLFWYPVPDSRMNPPLAPDIMVVLGRPKGKRGAYRQWEENGIAPQVVFEIVSPSNTAVEMKAKKNFYEKYGVQEYYVYDPERNRLEVWMRQEQLLNKVPHIRGWVSPLLGIRFKTERQTLRIFYPSGQPFLSSIELHQYVEEERQRAEAEKQHAEEERQRAEAAEQCAEEERRGKDVALREKEVERQRAEAEKQHAEEERQRAEAAEQYAEEEWQRAEVAEQNVEKERQEKESALVEIERLRARCFPLFLYGAMPGGYCALAARIINHYWYWISQNPINFLQKN